MIKIKAWNAHNSRAIAKFHNAEIDYFGLKLIGQDLFRGFLRTAARRYRLEPPAPRHYRVPGIP